MRDRIKELQLCAQDISANADKLLADVPYYQDCDIVIHIETMMCRQSKCCSGIFLKVL